MPPPSLPTMGCSIKSLRVISFLAAAFFSTTAGLGQFVVNTSDDTVDTNPGNGICADINGNCSLRAAIMEANSTPGANDIFVPNNTYIIGLDAPGEDGGLSGDLDIASEIAITG